MMKEKFSRAYMDVAERFSQLSSAVRLKVGAIVVKDNCIISIGYNGMPSGWDNNCEDVIQYSDDTVGLVTKPEVLHAETNALAKLAKSTNSSDNAVMFVTHAPCIQCSKLIYQSGISSVYYRNTYRSDEGLKFLKQCGIETKQI